MTGARRQIYDSGDMEVCHGRECGMQFADEDADTDAGSVEGEKKDVPGIGERADCWPCPWPWTPRN